MICRQSVKMSHGVVATQTRDLSAVRRLPRFDGIDDFSMTVATGLLGDRPAVRFDLNIILVATGREEKGVPEAI